MTTFLGLDSGPDDHIDALAARGYDVRVVTAGTDKASVLREFAIALALPRWFGHNWDALLDSLRELEGSDGRPLALVWDHVRGLRDSDRHTYADVIDILEQVQGERDDLRVTVIAR
ncbi:barnase inhibitor [Humibacillus sp. DSM 29435]|uniref:barstar family protein n=1 Tax=Humibacillus sp. DSM 29435 TaxID=1869167 RepID=UPI00087324AD|nr:barstar family protein [Humibacillus sp. DSM 29435]OFE16630.1 barnase inhibitor [Humibacillus sp. DSM 29435]